MASTTGNPHTHHNQRQTHTYAHTPAIISVHHVCNWFRNRRSQPEECMALSKCLRSGAAKTKSDGGDGWRSFVCSVGCKTLCTCRPRLVRVIKGFFSSCSTVWGTHILAAVSVEVRTELRENLKWVRRELLSSSSSASPLFNRVCVTQRLWCWLFGNIDGPKGGCVLPVVNKEPVLPVFL